MLGGGVGGVHANEGMAGGAKAKGQNGVLGITGEAVARAVDGDEDEGQTVTVTPKSS
ncbi:hypothetical protein GCM10009560_32660 [Nonomuraea longicatena]|uniref:Uncharacterized protein n=1 Tax=Nonomuraea longicatena TaxID=83682 RepID=A0ABP3ZYP9_9ACTN